MNIISKRDESNVKAKTLKPGDVFYFDDTYFMTVRMTNATYSDCIPVINFKNDTVEYITPGTDVKIVKANLVIED